MCDICCWPFGSDLLFACGAMAMLDDSGGAIHAGGYMLLNTVPVTGVQAAIRTGVASEASGGEEPSTTRMRSSRTK